jgi:phosphoribosylanthranilate isomerase
MIGRITLKICGITRAEDATAAAETGADWLGFIFYPPSPRNLTIAQYEAMRLGLPPVKKVAVCVEPTLADLTDLAAHGFDAFQIHFAHTTPTHCIAAWAEMVGISRLWLAPKLPPGEDVKPEWLPLAGTILLDTFHREKYGGTGETGDWGKFRRHAAAHLGKTWILSGGLNPGNVRAAQAATGARFLDVNSGVESEPGTKNQMLLKKLASIIQSPG